MELRALFFGKCCEMEIEELRRGQGEEMSEGYIGLT